jgi:hypothetical protein
MADPNSRLSLPSVGNPAELAGTEVVECTTIVGKTLQCPVSMLAKFMGQQTFDASINPDPNGQVYVQGPALIMGSDYSLWGRKTETPGNTGWVNLIK